MRLAGRVIACVVVAGCGSDSTPLDAPRGDSNLGSRGLDGGACVLAMIGTDPTANCFAQWTCPTHGTIALACGVPSDAGIACACVVGEDVVSTVSGGPADCSDAAMMTAFARQMCGWTFL